VARWEVADEDWDRVRDRLWASLVDVARREGLVSYTDLVSDVPELEGPHSHALAELLGEICDRCHAQGRPLLPALVVYRGPDRHGPGAGFYDAARRLGLHTGDDITAREEFWWHQVALCHESWQRG
jgi:hypothetical protein